MITSQQPFAPCAAISRYPNQHGVLLPKCIAHRGYSAKYPENSLAAFTAAVEAGAHAIETDLRITKDGIVVLSHNATLKQCFGRKEKVSDCTWPTIEGFRTLKSPHEPLATLEDVLLWLSPPEMNEVVLVLDVKVDQDPARLLKAVASLFATVTPYGIPWKERTVFGIYSTQYLAPLQNHLPGYSTVHIGWSLSYARPFFAVPNIGFTMPFPILVGPGGGQFVGQSRADGERAIITWVAESEARIRVCVRKGFSGVIITDPRKYLTICNSIDGNRSDSAGLFALPVVDLIQLWITIIGGALVGWLFRPPKSPVKIRNESFGASFDIL